MNKFILYFLIIYIVKTNYQLLVPTQVVTYVSFVYWIIGIFDIIIRKYNLFEKYKLKKYRKENVTELQMAPTVLFNLLISYIYFNYIYQSITNRGFVSPNEEPSFLKILFDLLISFGIYDVFFYLGHSLLHLPYFYKYHKKHHSTMGTIGISAVYMDKLDYFLESTLPFTAAIFIYNGNLVSTYCLGIIGTINTITTHMIYDFPFIPYSPEHLTHHLELKYNFGCLFMDYLFRTNVQRKYI